MLVDNIVQRICEDLTGKTIALSEPALKPNTNVFGVGVRDNQSLATIADASLFRMMGRCRQFA